VKVLVNAQVARTDPDAAAKLAAAFAATGCTADVQVASGDRLSGLASAAVHRGEPAIAAAGGDGTLSTIAAVLAGTGTALGILPMGTLNHFAKDLGIPLALDDAVRAIAAGHRRPIDVGDVNGRPFINNASVGAYPRIVAEREQRMRRGRSKWQAQALAALTVWMDHRLVRMSIRGDGINRSVKTPFLFVGNNVYGLEGGDVGRRDALDRGVLHVCLAPDISRAGAAALVAASLFGHLGRLQRLESILTPTLAVDAPHSRLQLSLDGEITTLDLPLAFSIRPGVLQVLAPEQLQPA
jgi:diacylglycerol kinase family enzyme